MIISLLICCLRVSTYEGHDRERKFPLLALQTFSRFLLRARKRFSDQFFAFLPKGFRRFGIERVWAHAFAYGADRHSLRDNFSDMAVFAVAAANLLSLCDDTGPHRRCRSLWDGLPREWPLSLCDELVVHLLDHDFEVARVHVPAKLGLDDSRMHGSGAHSASAVPLVEGDGEQNVCGLRSAIRDEGIVRRALKVRIVEVHVREAMTCRRQVDQSPSSA